MNRIHESSYLWMDKTNFYPNGYVIFLETTIRNIRDVPALLREIDGVTGAWGEYADCPTRHLDGKVTSYSITVNHDYTVSHLSIREAIIDFVDTARWS